MKPEHHNGSRAAPPYWDDRPVGEIGSVLGGGTPSRVVPGYWGGEIPWVTPGELTSLDGKEVHTTVDRITQAGLDSSGARLLPAGALLVTSRATLGAVAIAAVPMATNQGFKSIICGPDSDPNFYYHVFKRGVPQLTRWASGTTFLEIPATEFRKIRLPAPPLPDQHRVATVLDTLDEAIHNTGELLAKLDRLRFGLVHDLLTRGVEKTGELRDPTRTPEDFQHTLLGLLPRAWRTVSVTTLVDAPHAFIQTGPFGSQLHASDYVSDGVPVVMPQDIVDGAIDLSRAARIHEVKAARLGRHKLQAGDVIFARRGDLSKCATVTDDEAGWLCGTGCLLLRPPRGPIRADWLAAVYRHDMCQRQIAATAVGSTMVNLNSSLLGALAIPVPPKSKTESATSCLRIATSSDPHDVNS